MVDRDASFRAPGTGKDRWPLALPVLTVVAVGVSMARRGAELRAGNLAISWQLVELPVLRDDPIGSTWYLHTQPPLFNLAIGSVLRWSPFPEYGTLVVGFLACLALTGVLLADLLVRWRVPAVAAGAIASLAVALPAPVSSIVLPSYEVPLATLLALSMWLVQRHLDRPATWTLLVLAGSLTALALTRSLFHPVWVLAVLALVATARPLPWRTIGLAAAIPVLLVGGWMGKNQVLFGEPTLSSWFGFNLQRGVTAPMDAGAVQRDIDARRVSDLADQPPFGTLEAYGVACRADGRHPALATEVKVRTDFAEVPNFNNPCYFPIYRATAEDARSLARRHPGDYLAGRPGAYLFALRTADVGVDDPQVGLAGGRQAETTWMDRLGDVVLLPVGSHVSTRGWNIPLLAGVDELPIEVSLTLAVGVLVVLGRGGAAVVALGRRWRSRHEEWAGEELVWVVLASTVGLVVVLAGLVELGENDRFRATVDPFLVALPLGLAARAGSAAVRGRRAAAN